MHNFNMIEEVEIKIEYVNTNETDPLNEYENHDSGSKNTVGYCEATRKPSYILKHICDDSNSKLQNISKLNTTTWHKSIDSNGRLLCNFCDLKYSTTQTLRHHIKMKHPNIRDTLKKYTLKNKRTCKHRCHFCKKYFENVEDLRKHVNSSHSIIAISLSCLYCDANFTNNNELADHMYLKHNKVCDTFTCEICGYRTIKKSHLIKHTKTHVPEKDITCQYCDYATNNLANFKEHEHIHRNSRPYVCNYNNCDYQSSSRAGLRSHQLKHFREVNTLFCDKCNYSTVYKNSLKRHLDSHGRLSVRNL